jgi:hypothetical protein
MPTSKTSGAIIPKYNYAILIWQTFKWHPKLTNNNGILNVLVPNNLYNLLLIELYQVYNNFRKKALIAQW